MESNNHVWSFSIIGGVKRVNLESGGDIAHLASLDPKLWTALSCPVDDLEIDKKTLDLIDSDKDGHIRVPEVIGAANWILSILKSPDDLLLQADVFPLSAINDSSEQGKILLDSAKTILKNLDKETATSLVVEQTSDTVKIFANSRFNGDGIITEDSAGGDEKLAELITEMMLCAGSVTDRNGKQGISMEILESFFEQSEKYSTWLAKKEADLDAILPFGDNTTAAYDNYTAIKSKVDDFFIRCRLAAFDPQATGALNLQTTQLATITDKDLSACLNEIANYPIARIEPNSLLPLSSGINPAWEAIVAAFKELTASRLFPGKDNISEQEWNKVSQTFAAFAAWRAEKEGAMIEPLGPTRVREILSGSSKQQLISLLEQDKAVEAEANNIILVDQLVRYYRDLFKLLKNFVTFFDFYNPGSKAIFQAGTLYIDQRSCDLCINVRDMGKQAVLASFSGMYLLYCECVSKTTSEKMMIVAALTNGDVDDIMVGRNALFYDRKGLDWDATIVKIVDNPISIRQAFFSPYRKLLRFVETQVNKAAAAQDQKAAANMEKNVTAVPATVDDSKAKKDTPPPFDVGKFAGIFAAIGLAIGAIGTVIAAVLGGFMKLVWWKMPLAIIGMLLIISGPSMILAYFKLRKRNLAPILDANGWAINARVKINIQFGRTLTHLAILPKGSKVNLNDPFSKKKSPLSAILIILVVACLVLYILWKHGYIHLHF